jgi:type II secretory pathway pseudopilin PulG
MNTQAQRQKRKSAGLTILDALVTLCLAGLLVGVVMPRYQRLAREAQEAALRMELSNIRLGITLFKMTSGGYPGSLKELTEKNVILPARTGTEAYSGSFFQQKYLMANAVDPQGNLLDPFGNPFSYNPMRGEVRSSTRGFETW